LFYIIIQNLIVKVTWYYNSMTLAKFGLLHMSFLLLISSFQPQEKNHQY